MLRNIAASRAVCFHKLDFAAMRLEAPQVGYSRLAHSMLPISGKPEIGGRPVLRDGRHARVAFSAGAVHAPSLRTRRNKRRRQADNFNSSECAVVSPTRNSHTPRTPILTAAAR